MMVQWRPPTAARNRSRTRNSGDTTKKIGAEGSYAMLVLLGEEARPHFIPPRLRAGLPCQACTPRRAASCDFAALLD
jgi:hypothetical protein